MQDCSMLDAVMIQRSSILQLFARKDEPLLAGRDSLLVLNHQLEILNRVQRIGMQGDRLARQRLDLWSKSEKGGRHKGSD